MGYIGHLFAQKTTDLLPFASSAAVVSDSCNTFSAFSIQVFVSCVLRIILLSLRLFHVYQFDVKETDPEFTKTRILEALNRIQYHRIEQNYASLARKLLIGDKNEIYNILQYILKDDEKIRNAVYLSK